MWHMGVCQQHGFSYYFHFNISTLTWIIQNVDSVYNRLEKIPNKLLQSWLFLLLLSSVSIFQYIYMYWKKGNSSSRMRIRNNIRAIDYLKHVFCFEQSIIFKFPSYLVLGASAKVIIFQPTLTESKRYFITLLSQQLNARPVHIHWFLQFPPRAAVESETETEIQCKHTTQSVYRHYTELFIWIFKANANSSLRAASVCRRSKACSYSSSGRTGEVKNTSAKKRKGKEIRKIRSQHVQWQNENEQNKIRQKFNLIILLLLGRCEFDVCYYILANASSELRRYPYVCCCLCIISNRSRFRL